MSIWKLEQQAKDLYKQGYSYSVIGRKLGIGYEGAHKLIKNYKNVSRFGREEKYTGMDNCDRCKIKKAKHLHHKDQDNTNDDQSNLQPLCLSCHATVHAELKKTPEYKERKRIEKIKRKEYEEESFMELQKSLPEIVNRKTLIERLHMSLRTIIRMERRGMPVLIIGHRTRRYEYDVVLEWIKDNSKDANKQDDFTLPKIKIGR